MPGSSRVTSKRLGIAAVVLLVDAALLLIVGISMWREALYPADEAVGKGLVALGTAFGIPAFVLVCAFLDSRAQVAPTEEPARSDWDTV
jgi:hypothetical protein